MGTPTDDVAIRRTLLSNALKAVRRRRGLRSADVAAAMGMPLRSYEHFEAGNGRLDVGRVHRFAQALEADPLAILAALEIRSPEFAARCADNKLVTILVMALQDFDVAAQEDIAQLDAATLMGAFRRLFDHLSVQARDRRALAERWMSAKDRPDRDGDAKT